MKPNIGTLNALIRITLGLTLLSWGTGAIIRRSVRSMPMLAVLAGAMKVGEGITRFCPVVYMYEEQRGDGANENDFSPMNPS